MTTRLKVGVAVLAVLSALVSVQAAAAGNKNEVAASLTGEVLIASEAGDPGTSEVSGTCDPLGTSTFTFTVTGVATGPFPGTFVEEGTMSFGPFGIPGVGFEPVSFDANFTITSPAGTVTGTKTLTDVPSIGFGACGEFVFGGTEPQAVDFEGNTTYTATVTTPLGVGSDSGTSFVNYQDTQIRGVPGGNGFAFDESFTSTGGGGGDEDEDDDDQGEDEDDQGEDEG